MSDTQARISSIARKFLEPDREPDFDKSFGDSPISSMDCMAFVKAVGAEFNVDLSAEDFANFNCLRDLVNHLDSSAS